MKNSIKKIAVNLIGMVVVIGAVSAGTAFAQLDGGGRLTGTWDAVVAVTNCQTGDVIASFNSIASFNQGGTSIGSTAGIPQSLRTPEHGVWRHEKANIYMFKFKTFSFSAAGAPTGWSIVTHELELDEDNNSYTSAGTAQFFAPNGMQVGQACSSAVGTRFSL